jgi:hypothetical protein
VHRQDAQFAIRAWQINVGNRVGENLFLWRYDLEVK